MTLQTLQDALTLRPAEGRLVADISGDFSNGPIIQPPEKGFPFGGLLAALCAGSMRQGLGLSAPLRTLSVQYLAAARYGELGFRPRLLRGGRSIAYAAVDVSQGERLNVHAVATYGDDNSPPVRCEIVAPPPPLDTLDPARTISGPLAPRFSQYVEYRFESGPNILGGNADKPAVERLWMRTRDGAPLDELRLCYLLDALYPPAWTTSPTPPMMASVDLRYDFIADPTPETAPDGWCFLEFRMLDLGGGWTVDDATAWGADGRPLAVARQRRRLAPVRMPRGPGHG